jgi:hypothetical protein
VEKKRELKMSLKSEEYVVKLEKFLGDLGVTGAYFCAKQYERWRGLARQAFEEASASATTSDETEQKPKEKKPKSVSNDSESD